MLRSPCLSFFLMICTASAVLAEPEAPYRDDDGSLIFSVEWLHAARERLEQEPRILQLLGEAMDSTESALRALKGPTSQEHEAALEADAGSDVAKGFEALYGSGAIEFYRDAGPDAFRQAGDLEDLFRSGEGGESWRDARAVVALGMAETCARKGRPSVTFHILAEILHGEVERMYGPNAARHARHGLPDHAECAPELLFGLLSD